MYNVPLLSNPTQEEIFDLWTDDLIELGYIDKVLKQQDIPSSIILFDQFKIKNKITGKLVKLLSDVKYKPDRVIFWNKKSKDIFFSTLENYTGCYFIGQYDDIQDVYISTLDVKAPPGYGGINSSDVSFAVKQKWVFDKTNIFVNKVVNYPNSRKKLTKKQKKEGALRKFKEPKPYLFMRTFTPSRYLITDKATKLRTINNWIPITLQEFLKNPKKINS